MSDYSMWKVVKRTIIYANGSLLWPRVVPTVGTPGFFMACLEKKV